MLIILTSYNQISMNAILDTRNLSRPVMLNPRTGVAPVTWKYNFRGKLPSSDPLFIPRRSNCPRRMNHKPHQSHFPNQHLSERRPYESTPKRHHHVERQLMYDHEWGRRTSDHGGKRKSSHIAAAEIFEKSENDEDLSGVYDSDEDEDDEEEDDIYENIKVQKEIISSVRLQPWPMSKKLKLLQLAKNYVEKHEGKLSKSHEYQEKGMQIWKMVERECSNIVSFLTPWEMRVKGIESHFGSVVASYFVFLRWIIWVNLWLTLLPVCFIIIPEVPNTFQDTLGKIEQFRLLSSMERIKEALQLIVGAPHDSQERKTVPEEEEARSMDLKTIWDAEGIVEYSVIFYGYYGNQEIIGRGYRLPLAYLLTGFSAFVLSFVIVLRKMASNFRQSRLSNKDEQFTFSWRLFGSWDYMIGNTETANNKVASIVTTFREAILEEKERKKSTNMYRLLALRILANICVILLLGLSTYIIQLCVERTREMDIMKRKEHVTFNFWRENELTVVMTLISTIFPSLFDLVSLMEHYHPRTNLRWQLARIFVLNLLNLYTLFIALFWKQQDLKKEIHQQRLISANCSDSHGRFTESISINSSSNFLNTTISTNCSQYQISNSSVSICWETMIGQEVVKLTIMDLVFVLGTILIQDFIRGLFVRYCNVLCCWDLEKKFPEYGDFKTAENLLHLINNQGVIWLGTFFSPGLPVLNLLKLLILLYVRCWSVMVCNVPQEAIFRSSRSNNFYYGLLLIMLFLSMLPPLFAIVAVEPSPDCGPFSGQEKMFHILTETLENELPPLATSVLNYAASPGVIIPVFMLLVMCIYYLVSVSKALRESNQDLQRELQYERNEGKRKVYAMADAKRNIETDESGGLLIKKIKGMSTAASSVIAAARMAKILSSTKKSVQTTNTEADDAKKKFKNLVRMQTEKEARQRKSTPDTAMSSSLPNTQSLDKEFENKTKLATSDNVRGKVALRNAVDKIKRTTQSKATPVAVVRASLRRRVNTAGKAKRSQQVVQTDTILVEPVSNNKEDEVVTDETDHNMTQRSDDEEDEVVTDETDHNMTRRSDDEEDSMVDIEHQHAEGKAAAEARFCHAATQTHYEEVNETRMGPRDRLASIQRYKVNLQQKRKAKRQAPNVRPRSSPTRVDISPNPSVTKVATKRGSTLNDRVSHLLVPRTRQARPVTEDFSRRHTPPVLEKRQSAIRSQALQKKPENRRNTLQIVPEIRISSY